MFTQKRLLQKFFGKPGETLFLREYEKDDGKHIVWDSQNIPINLAHMGINASWEVIKQGAKVTAYLTKEGLKGSAYLLKEGAKASIYVGGKAKEYLQPKLEEAARNIMSKLEQEAGDAKEYLQIKLGKILEREAKQEEKPALQQ